MTEPRPAPPVKPDADRLNEALMSAWQLIAGEQELDRIFDGIARTAEMVTGATRCSVALIEGEQLRFVYTTGPEIDQLKQVRMKLGVGIMGTVAATGKPARVHQVEADPRFYDRIDRALDFETRSMLCVALQAQGKVIGTLQVLNKQAGAAFSGEDEVALTSFAQQAAVAIERHRLHDSVVAQSRRIQGIFEALSDGLMVVDATSGKPILYNRAVETIFFPEGRPNYALTTYLANLINLNRETGGADIVLFKPHGVVLANRYVIVHDETGKPREVVVSLRNITEQKTRERRFSQFYALMLHHNLRLVQRLRRAVANRQGRTVRRLQAQLERLAGSLVYLTDLQAGPLRIEREFGDFCAVYRGVRRRYARRIRRCGILFCDQGVPAGVELSVRMDLVRIRHLLQILFDVGLRLLRGANQAEFRLTARLDQRQLLLAATWAAVPLVRWIDTRSLDCDQQIDEVLQGHAHRLDLGLPFLHHIVRAHKGTVTVEGEPDRSVTVAVTLPVE